MFKNTKMHGAWILHTIESHYYCWFCGTKFGDIKSSFNAKLYRYNGYSSHATGWTEYYDEKIIKIPRCKRCKNIHKITEGLAIIGLVTGLIIVFSFADRMFNFLTPYIQDDGASVFVLMLVVFGPVFGYHISKKSGELITHKKITPASNVDRFPLVREEFKHRYRLSQYEAKHVD